MPVKSNTYQDATTDVGQSVTEKVSEVASQVKDQVSGLGQTAVDKINENRGAAASGLQSAASALHENAGSLPGGEKVASLAHSAAEKMSTTAEYVKDHDVKSMMGDVEQLVKNNPGPSLVAAAVIGFLVGRAFSSND